MASPSLAVDFGTLPHSGATVLHWTWDDYAPYFSALVGTSLGAGNVGPWLADWSRVGDLVQEQGARLQIAAAADTRDDAKRAQLEAFQQQLLPSLLAADHELKLKLLESAHIPSGMEIPVRKMQAETEYFRPENLPLLARQSELGNEYNRICGEMTVDWDGRQATLAELRTVLQEPDRARREQAWRLIGARFRQDHGRLGELWTELLDLRVQMAANAGCASYRDYVWPLKHRFDYTPADCLEYQRSALATVVPAVHRRQKRLRERLGVDTLRPWDVSADAASRQPLRPFSDGAVLEAKCGRILNQLDPELGAQYALLRDGQLDLANRPGKAPGGWCSDYPAIKRPFIFMNAVGLHSDVQTLLHEAGHAFHGFATYNLPYAHQRDCFMEFNEVASMAMELLAAPYLTEDRGGFYTPADGARARVDHLDSMLNIWVMVAAGDAFQHWVYENPREARDVNNCHAKYLELWREHQPGLDGSGLEEELATRWMMTLHFYLVPFYYIEYGLAQLGAVQVWQNAEVDAAKALADYKRALHLGGTVGVHELYAATGARFAFDAATFGSCVGTVERLIRELEPAADAA